jgi:hypothetical protein
LYRKVNRKHQELKTAYFNNHVFLQFDPINYLDISACGAADISQIILRAFINYFSMVAGYRFIVNNNFVKRVPSYFATILFDVIKVGLWAFNRLDN